MTWSRHHDGLLYPDHAGVMEPCHSETVWGRNASCMRVYSIFMGVHVISPIIMAFIRKIQVRVA